MKQLHYPCPGICHHLPSIIIINLIYCLNFESSKPKKSYFVTRHECQTCSKVLSFKHKLQIDCKSHKKCKLAKKLQNSKTNISKVLCIPMTWRRRCDGVFSDWRGAGWFFTTCIHSIEQLIKTCKNSITNKHVLWVGKPKQSCIH